jgi:hypothetical protein
MGKQARFSTQRKNEIAEIAEKEGLWRCARANDPTREAQ